MRSVRFLTAAGAASLLLSSAAFAADMPIAPPPAYYPPPPPQEFGGWYLRGDIGMTNQQLKSLNNVDSVAAGSKFDGLGFDSATLFGVGVGYQVNNWFRADVTGQYRGRANFHGSENFNIGTAYFVNNYSGSKSETTILANIYADLGTWWCVTPFIGAGVGTSYNKISSFRDVGLRNEFGVSTGSTTYASDNGKWNLAWALHTGLAYKVNPNLTVELGYSYVSLGDGVTGVNKAFDGSAVPQNTWTMKDITSHDLKLGVRWNFDTPPVYAPPLMRKG